MTVFSDLQTVLETTGSKVFANKKLDSVKTALVYKSIGQRIIGSMSGNAGLNIERLQVSCFATNETTLQNMASTVEQLLAFYNSSSFTSIPTESKIEGFDTNTSTFFSYRDFYLIY
jgi:hypothetical protein